MAKKNRSNEPEYCTDRLYKGLWFKLAQDFRQSLGDDFGTKPEIELREDPKNFRAFSWGGRMLAPYYYFKAELQLESLFKRYRFQNDVYSDEELERETFDKFRATQVRIAEIRWDSVPFRSKLIVKRARQIIAKILGDYDQSEHEQACRFGKRASVGVPAHLSYLDERLGRFITGSRKHIDWFQDLLTRDPLLERSIDLCLPMAPDRWDQCSCLSLTCVPKSWKSFRGIMPNTTIGGFYTYGLGKVIQKRLTCIGLNIRYLQRKHRRLVLFFSKSRTHVTADLSSASDSFTSWLVNLLVPRKWYNVLKLGRMTHYREQPKVGTLSRKLYMSSFMTMGIGFTFQLQTLLFYGLLKAIQDLSGIKGLVSVYGDDLIYPSGMHSFVRQSFGDLGFLLNDDKTFVKESFRESCGADAYCGFDVRPFSPKGDHQMLKGTDYEALLYKTINGLLLRWNRHEIPEAIEYLKLELLRLEIPILQVPPDFPDYSGIKSDYIDPYWGKFPIRRDRFYRYTDTPSASITFDSLKYVERNRVVTWQSPFLWEWLRARNDSCDHFNPFDEEENASILRWIPHRRKKKVTVRHGSKRVSKVRKVAVVSKKGCQQRLTRQTGSIDAWDRRHPSGC